MKIVNPSVEFITPLNGPEVIKRLEQCGRVCYKSEDRITQDSGIKFLERIIKNGHESVLEHCSITVKFICSRAISHQIVRHRIAAYSQESTRYCNYSNDKFGKEITVVKPFYCKEGTRVYNRWKKGCCAAEDTYFDLLEMGCMPQEARGVLPHDLKTEIVVTYDIREWRHFLRVRCSKTAHPQIRELATQVLRGFYKEFPVLFDDIYMEIMAKPKERA
jgi:thymidylate synthase (FAD)